MRFRVISAVALVVASSVACDNTSTNGVFTERNATIVMPGLSFSPDAVTIPVGGKVLWVGSGVTHNVAFGGGEGAPSGCPNWSVGDCLRQFDVAGSFGYICTIPGHGSMVGLIKVE